MTIASDIATHIASRVAVTPAAGQVAGPVDLTYGENCRNGPMRKASQNQAVTGAVPNECVFVLGIGGTTDEPFHADANNTEPEDWPGIDMPSVLVTIRSPPKNFDRGQALADAVFAAIDKSIPSGFFEMRALNSQASYINEDNENHHYWTVNVEAKRCF